MRRTGLLTPSQPPRVPGAPEYWTFNSKLSPVCSWDSETTPNMRAQDPRGSSIQVHPWSPIVRRRNMDLMRIELTFSTTERVASDERSVFNPREGTGRGDVSLFRFCKYLIFLVDRLLTETGSETLAMDVY